MDKKEYNRQIKSKNSGRYPWDKIEKEGYCSVCAIKKGSQSCEKCKHKEESNDI